jgi:hypothetical protein
MSQLTEEAIAERLDDEGEAPQPAAGLEGGTRDAEFDYERTPKHRPFRTRRPDGSTVQDEEEEEDDRDEQKGSSVVTKVFLLLGGVVFLAVVLVVLVFLIGRTNQNQIQAGNETERPGAQRELDAARQSADDAKKAVTEAAQPKPTQQVASSPGGLQPAGDLSMPISPDPIAASGYAPNAVAPPVGGAGTSPTPASSSAGAGGSTEGGPESHSGERGTARGDRRDDDRDDARTERSQPGSFYFFTGNSSQGQTLSSGGREPRPGGGVDQYAATQQLIKPPFGALLPVRLLDSVMTLREGGLVRLETTRAAAGPGGWNVPRGTTVVARLAGGDRQRAYLNVVGFIDAGSNKLVNVTGEVKGSDGAQGVRGERKRVNSVFKDILKTAGRSGYSLATTLGSAYLLGRSGGSGYFPATQTGLPGLEGARASSSEINDFLYVRAGSQAYVLVTDLPASAEGRDAATIVDSGELTDDELMRLISEGSPEQIRAAMPRMNPDLRRLAETVLAQEPH